MARSGDRSYRKRVRNPGNFTRKPLGFTRYLETVSCPGQAVFFDGQSFRGDPFNPTYSALDLYYRTCVIKKVNLVRSRETIHGLPFLSAIMHFAFGRVRRKIARLRTYPKIQTGVKHYVQSMITPKYSSFRSVNPS